MKFSLSNKFNEAIFVLIILCTIGSGELYAQRLILLEKTHNLDSLKGTAFQNAVNSIYNSFDTIVDANIKNEITNIIFEKTKNKDERSHISSLVMMARYSDKPKENLFEEAFQLARKSNLTDEMCFVEYYRSQYYLSKSQYDSAMIYLLSYRDMTPDKSSEGYRNILNLLGDIYYHAGLYDQAYIVYYELFEQYEKDDNWDFYRPYVLMNDMGQIALKNNDLIQAEQWFRKSLELAEENLFQKYRDNTIAYTKILLALKALESNNIVEAEYLLNQVDSINPKEIYEDVYQEYIFTRAKLLLKKENIEDALELARKLSPEDSTHFNKYRFIPEIYQFLADIYNRLGNHEHSLLLLKEYQQTSDSLHMINNIAQSMILLADKNYEEAKLDLQKSNLRIKMLVTGVLVLVIVLLIMLLLYRKLYYSKLQLVKSSIEKTIPDKFVNINKQQNHNKNLIPVDEALAERELMVKLHEHMEKHKPYLNQKLSIDELAKQLATNRTYLSRAINHQLQTSFPNFLNKYRIREAIILIIEGYTVNHTQEALAKESGFSSRTVFISAFKKHTGVVPSFFIANYKKEK